MTQNQIPPEPPINASDPPTGDNSQPTANPDWESRMARLVGLEESQSSEEDSATTRQSLSEPEEPQEVQSRSPLSSNPFAKLGLVGAGTLALVVSAGVFLTVAMNPGNQKPKQNPTLVVQEPRSQRTTKPVPQEEIEALKTKLALAEQAQAVQIAQRQLRNQKPAPSPRITNQPTRRAEPPRVLYRDRPQVIAQRTPTPVQTVYLPPRVPIATVRPQSQPVRREPPRRVATPVPRTLPPVLPPLQPSQTTPTPPPVVATTPSPTPDPMQQWARLAKLGSYGQVPSNKNQSVNNATIAQANTFQPPPPITIPQPPIRIPNQPSAVTKQNSKSTVVGSSAKAVLVTAVYGETTSPNRNSTRGGNRGGSSSGDNSGDSSNSNKDVFVARLTEPLNAADGSPILPKDTQIYLNIDSTSDSGLMKLNVVKVSWQEKNGNRIEKTVPQGNLVIRGSRGQPTVGEQQQNREGSRFVNDAKLGTLGGISKGAEILNRPKRNCRTYLINNGLNTNNSSNNNNTSSTTDSSNNNNPGVTNLVPYRFCDEDDSRNALSGFVEGATKDVTREVSRRIQQQNAPRQQRTNIWVIPPGKEVELFVNGQIQL